MVLNVVVSRPLWEIACWCFWAFCLGFLAHGWFLKKMTAEAWTVIHRAQGIVDGSIVKKDGGA